MGKEREQRGFNSVVTRDQVLRRLQPYIVHRENCKPFNSAIVSAETVRVAPEIPIPLVKLPDFADSVLVDITENQLSRLRQEEIAYISFSGIRGRYVRFPNIYFTETVARMTETTSLRVLEVSRREIDVLNESAFSVRSDKKVEDVTPSYPDSVRNTKTIALQRVLNIIVYPDRDLIALYQSFLNLSKQEKQKFPDEKRTVLECLADGGDQDLLAMWSANKDLQTYLS